MDTLKLVALDKDDLDVISAHVQDSVVKVSDVLWRPKEQRLVVGLNRFDWELAQGGAPEYQRRRVCAALRSRAQLQVPQRRSGRQGSGAQPARPSPSTERDPPGGVVTLTFSDGAVLRLDVECLEAEIADLGPVWTTACCPCHADAAGRKTRYRQRSRSVSATSSASLTSLWTSSRMTRAVIDDR